MIRVMGMLYVLNLSSTLSDIALKFEQLINKLTSNGTIASFLTIAVFVILCLIVGNMANK